MKVAVINRPNDPDSLQIYYSNLTFELSALGIEIVPFGEEEPIPQDYDLVWDPGMCMRPIPLNILNSTIPVIGSMHGVKAYSLPIHELVTNQEEEQELITCKNLLDQQWKEFKDKITALVTVSEYGKREITNAVNIKSEKVFTIYNGVNTAIFKKEGKRKSIGKPYFFHVSTVNPLKNFNRLLSAYLLLPENTRPDLVAIIPDYTKMVNAKGLHIISDSLSQEEIAEWYRGAIALILPSLRETFGMPIIEAMRCGIPVITSNVTACAEIAGDAATLVDPRSVEDLKNAMSKIHLDPNYRDTLISKGIQHSSKFSWEESAIQFRQLFNQVIKKNKDKYPKMRKLEVTTTVGCQINCSFCPHSIFYKNYLKKVSDNRHMSFNVFKTCIDKLPADVGVSFGGMSEPFQNKECVEMVLYAKEKGHAIEIFTTMSGLNFADLKRLTTHLALGTKSTDDKLYIHLPSDNNWEHITIDHELIEKINFLISNDFSLEFHYHGENIHSTLQNIEFKHRLNHWPLHDRSLNETTVIKKSKIKKGKISCVMNMEVNFLIPSGDVLLCCQDFGIDFIIGNLVTDDFESLYKSRPFKRVLGSLQDDSINSVCRNCHFAVEIGHKFDTMNSKINK